MATIERKAGPVRKGDPETSHLAAAEVGPRILRLKDRIETILQTTGRAFTHDALISEYKRQALELGWPPASDSGIRTRCNELLKAGRVERVEEECGASRFGRPSILWRAVIVQNSETVDTGTVDGAA